MSTWGKDLPDDLEIIEYDKDEERIITEEQITLARELIEKIKNGHKYQSGLDLGYRMCCLSPTEYDLDACEELSIYFQRDKNNFNRGMPSITILKDLSIMVLFWKKDEENNIYNQNSIILKEYPPKQNHEHIINTILMGLK